MKHLEIISYLVFFIIIIVNFNFTIQDLPIHCLKHQIVGKWTIKATQLFDVKNGHEMRCGHVEPSKEELSFKAESNLPFLKKFDLELYDNDLAVIQIDSNTKFKGKWTMVYDEGFDVIFPNYSFFAFSNYSIEKDLYNNIIKYKSFCYSTCVGWYKNGEGNKRGCYRAEKKSVDSNSVSFINTKNIDNRKVASLNVEKIIEPMRFFELNKFKEKFASKLIVDNLNKIKKSWTAVEYPQFMNNTIEELNLFAGMVRNSKHLTRGIHNLSFEENYLFRFKNLKINNKGHSIKENKDKIFEVFPKNFDWKDKLKPASNQGHCGSCYAWSAIRMLESRIKLIYDMEIKLSVQHTLDCSYYNQGCRGGYSYLVMKFANEFELVPEDCHPYKAVDGSCKNSCDTDKLDVKFKVDKYGYLGGGYGKCTETLMMQELRKSGPFVVSIEPDLDFMFYKSGVYQSIDESSWIKQGLTKPEWQKVDHSVLLVGWGEDEETKQKFWLIQNSWGSDWGENGFFRIRRGVDELNVESICEIGTPKLIRKSERKGIKK